MSQKMTAQEWHDEYFKALAREKALLNALKDALRENHELGAISKPTADEARAAIAQSEAGK